MAVKDYFGAGASFPKAAQWQVWTDHHASLVKQAQPIEKFIIDATKVLQMLHLKMAMELRKTREEQMSIKDVVDERVAWFKKNRAALATTGETYRELKLVLEALDGAFAVSERLAGEIDLALRRGYVLVDTGKELGELHGVGA